MIPSGGSSEVVCWIPIAERLPEDDSIVLINNPYSTEPPRFWQGYYDGNGGWFCEDHWAIDEGKVTHWAVSLVGPGLNVSGGDCEG